jgi:hypothetical protein
MPLKKTLKNKKTTVKKKVSKKPSAKTSKTPIKTKKKTGAVKRTAKKTTAKKVSPKKAKKTIKKEKPKVKKKKESTSKPEKKSETEKKFNEIKKEAEKPREKTVEKEDVKDEVNKNKDIKERDARQKKEKKIKVLAKKTENNNDFKEDGKDVKEDLGEVKKNIQSKIEEEENEVSVKKEKNKNNIKSIEEKPKKQKIINKRPINMYRKIAISFIALTVILLSVVVYFTFVSVEIVLTPSQERVSDNLIVDIYDKESYENSPSASLAGVVEEVELEAEKVYESTGVETLGEEISGKVRVINNYTKNQPLVATTRLLSPDNKLYRLKDTINVPAGSSVEAEIYVDEADPSMAIGPTKFIIPGLWTGIQDKIYAESSEKFVYSKKQEKFIQKIDVDMAVEDLKKELIAKAEKQFGENYKGYDKVLFEIDNNLINVDISDKVGDKKDSFKINLNSPVAVIAFNSGEVKTMAEKKLKAIVPDNKDFKEISSDNITFNLNGFNVNQGIATINASFESSMALKNDSDIIDKNKIIGLTEQQLRDYLKGFDEISDFKISFSPAFVEKVPNLIDRIYVKIE